MPNGRTVAADGRSPGVTRVKSNSSLHAWTRWRRGRSTPGHQRRAHGPASDVRRVTGGTRSAAGDFLRAPTSTADQTDHHANNKKESTTSRIRALSRLWCEVAPAEIRTCNLPIANPALYQTATRAPSINYIRSNYLRLQRLT